MYTIPWDAILNGMYKEWLRLVGSFKLYVFFAQDPYKRDYILQTRRIILRSLLIVATPYDSMGRNIQWE